MYEITIKCEKIGAYGGCHYAGGWRTNDLSEPPPPEYLAAFTEHGWVERDGKHYCELHNPDLAGEQVMVSRKYVEVAPGVHVRWPGAQQAGDTFPLEVKVEAAHADHDEPLTPEQIGKLRDAGLTAAADFLESVKPVVRRERVVSGKAPAKRTPEKWCEQYGVDIVDPDGWRHTDAPAWDEPITLADFYDRAKQCTIRNVASVDWSRIFRDAQGS